ncbi:MAG: WD40 repeat domain-containing protein, partial [Planctomycetales bacterium]
MRDFHQDDPTQDQAEAPLEAPGFARWTRALLRGASVAFFVGFLWGVFSFALAVRLEFLPALSLGFFVGRAVRGDDRRVHWTRGPVGAGLAILGCLWAETWALWGVAVFQLGFLPHVFFHPEALLALFRDHWRWLDLFVFAFVAWEGWYFAAQQVKSDAPRWWESLDGRKPTYLLTAMLAAFVGLMILNLHRTKIDDAAVSPDGARLAVSQSGYDTSVGRKAAIWKLPRGKPAELSQDRVGKLAWSPDSRLLAVVANRNTSNSPDPGRISLWDVAAERSVASLRDHPDFVK